MNYVVRFTHKYFIMIKFSVMSYQSLFYDMSLSSICSIALVSKHNSDHFELTEELYA